MKNAQTCISWSISGVVLYCLLTLVFSNVQAGEHTVKCKLYIVTSTDSDTGSTIKTENAGMLTTARRGSFCVFPDGSIADKQFTHLQHIPGDGSTGHATGFSIYTMDNGETITAQYNGGWDQDGFKATYVILGGTGQYAGATGDGTISGLPSPWKTTSVVDVVMNVVTP